MASIRNYWNRVCVNESNKHKSMRAIVFSLSALLFFAITSCNTTSVMVDVLEPAAINVPQEYQNVVIANRSLPAKGEKGKNFVEGLFSGEGVFNDRRGSEQAIQGINNKLNENERFESRICESCDFRGTGTAEWPTPLNWDSISQVCEQYGADALISLEVFDSDKHEDMRVSRRKRTVDGETQYYNRYEAHMEIRVTSGYRIYDPFEEKIIDENEFVDHKAWDRSGDSKREAIGRLPSHRDAVVQAGYYAGEQYAARISPTWRTTRRTIYIGGNDEMKSTKSHVKNDDWKKAASVWKKYVDSDDSKLAARACFNMAIAAEIRGDLDLALEWANKSWDLKKESRTRAYINLLHKRKQDAEKLDEQLQ